MSLACMYWEWRCIVEASVLEEMLIVSLCKVFKQQPTLHNVEPHSQSTCAWERDHIALQMNSVVITITL